MALDKTIEEAKAPGIVERLYEELRKQTGMVPNILKIFSLQPEAMRATMNIFQSLMYGPGPLPRAEREQVAEDYRKAELKPKTLAILEYAEKITGDHASVTQTEIRKLRATGLPDEEILHAASSQPLQLHQPVL